ncbi:PREDICTED: uncharacterized protein LOC109231458 [Nicotiana attenuata]|uniref:uncharacterized protein LOC109231458 n=1 Tax=Nicotiana attenuata TaxID=49451 RepID=UPI000904A2A6|nr:PREDICTED: uncharacterized protein LOC109231458 [Nicotiana attenuata]
MAIEDETSESASRRANVPVAPAIFPTIDHNHPLFLQLTDTPGSSFISLQLTGSDNYALWSRSMRIGLIVEHCSVCFQCHKVWEDLKERFDKVNGSRVLYLHREIYTLTRGTMSVADYFSKLRDLWDEFDALMPCPSCPCSESKKYAEHFEYHRLLQFLRLNDSYSQPRSQIMMMTPVPSINKAYSLLMGVESQRNLENFTQMVQVTEANDSTAMYGNKNPNSGTGQFRAQKKTLICDYYAVWRFTGWDSYYTWFSVSPNADECYEGPSARAATAGKLLALLSNCANPNWIIDSGASNHMTSTLEMLSSYQSISSQKGSKVHLPTGVVAFNTHIGKTRVLNNQEINNVLYIPEFKYNLLSVSKLTKELQCLVAFFPDFCIFQDLYSGQVKGIGKEDKGLYLLQGKSLLGGIFNHDPAQQRNKSVQQEPEVKSVYKSTRSENKSACMASEQSESSILWHKRLGHAPIDVIKKYTTLKDLKDHHTHCTVCPLAKQTKLPYKLSTTTSNAIFELIHCDSDTVVVLKEFLTKVKNVFSTAVKTLRTDNGSGFFNQEVHSLLSSLGLIHQSTCTYTPQQNGVAERRHRTILEVARALRFQAVVPLRFWGDCISTAVYLLN